MPNLLRRVRGICEFYNSRPAFICSSATIANPREPAEALTGERFELVDLQRCAARAEGFHLLQSAGSEPPARHPAQLR
jgi:DEAD/DEAH box helicase domain-containing protein